MTWHTQGSNTSTCCFFGQTSRGWGVSNAMVAIYQTTGSLQLLINGCSTITKRTKREPNKHNRATQWEHAWKQGDRKEALTHTHTNIHRRLISTHIHDSLPLPPEHTNTVTEILCTYTTLTLSPTYTHKVMWWQTKIASILKTVIAVC